MKTRLLVSVAVCFLLAGVLAYADDRPDEGKIVGVDTVSKLMLVQVEHGDQIELYWTETTKLAKGVTIGELRAGDEIHFDYVEKDGKKWLTELKRTHKADR